jgi:hypothetical protein
MMLDWGGGGVWVGGGEKLKWLAFPYFKKKNLLESGRDGRGGFRRIALMIKLVKMEINFQSFKK